MLAKKKEVSHLLELTDIVLGSGCRKIFVEELVDDDGRVVETIDGRDAVLCSEDLIRLVPAAILQTRCLSDDQIVREGYRRHSGPHGLQSQHIRVLQNLR